MIHRTITAEEARALREAATPGPWRKSDEWNVMVTAGTRYPVISAGSNSMGWPVPHATRGNTALIAAAPDLAATVEALHAEVQRLRDIERWAGELLARIHRDGGHHINNVGWKQAFLDADDCVVEWLGRCENAALEAAP